MRFLLLFCASAWAFSTAPVSAQIHSWSADSARDYFGNSVDGIGDIDGDGYDDVIVGAPHEWLVACGPGNPDAYARVYSGRDGAQLFELVGYGDDHVGTTVCGIGDWDADGTPDFAIANEPDYCCVITNPSARIYSGASGALLRTIFVSAWWDFYDQDMDGAGDVNGDGHADFILGEPAGSAGGLHRGSVWIYSGANGALIRQIDGSTDRMRLGKSVAGVGDWNGDMLDDVAVSTLSAFSRVYSAVDGAILFEVPVAGEVEDAEDFNGDGERDLLVTSGTTGTVFSGLDGSVLLSMTGWKHYRLAADVDADGRAEFYAGDPDYDSERGRVGLLSGADGNLMYVLMEGRAPGDRLGFDLAAAGDVNGDGVQDVIAGARDEGGRGAAHVLSGLCPPDPSNYCIAAPNSAGPGARLGYHGSWSLARNDLNLIAEGCPPNHFGIFFYATSPARLAFGNGYLCAGGSIFRLFPPISTGVLGVASYPIDFGSAPMNGGAGEILSGSTWYFQFWYRDVPAGGAFFNLSDGLNLSFCH